MKKPKVLAAQASLAQETRLEIFRLLVQQGPAGLPAGDIGDRIGLPSPTLSFHLSHLKHAGLVKARRQGRSIIYSADFTTMTGLMAYLTENCCGGRPGLCAPAGCLPDRSAEAEPKRKVR
jgi:DNA-binding transcriptional ArsR family regulator